MKHPVALGSGGHDDDGEDDDDGNHNGDDDDDSDDGSDEDGGHPTQPWGWGLGMTEGEKSNNWHGKWKIDMEKEDLFNRPL